MQGQSLLNPEVIKTGRLRFACECTLIAPLELVVMRHHLNTYGCPEINRNSRSKPA